MSLEKRCVTRLLDDSPVSDDSFRHKEVARAMAEVLTSEDGGRALALHGPWGSGKSTVIQLLLEELKASRPDTKVVQFDAWAHQGDPLRRTFLENAVAKLDPWLGDKEKWVREMDTLARRRVDTTTTSVPELSGWGILGAYALLVSPVAAQLFNAFHNSSDKTIPKSLQTLLWACASPLLVAAAITVIWSLKRVFGKRASFPSLIYTSSENRTKTSTSRTPDPTSLEFEATYCALLGDALAKEERRLIFIIDNLDRLPKEEARSVWANIKLFFDPSLHRSKWHTKVWVVIPFDQEAIAEIWEDKSNLGSDSAEIAETPHAVHFVEKTFQAAFRVPPAILTNWEGYFRSQMTVALPEHVGKDSDDIVRIFDRLRLNARESPTPRQIKMFINDLGSLHRQWQHLIPITTLAAFVLALSQKGNSFIAQLQNSNSVEFIPDAVARRLGHHWQRDLAALYYNVTPDMAYEALLSGPISLAIGAAELDGLGKLENSPGFAEVLQQCIESIYSAKVPPQDQISLLRAARNLSNLSEQKAEYTYSREVVFDRISSVPNWYQLNDDLGPGLIAAAQSNPKRDPSGLVAVLVSSIKTNAGTILTGSQLTYWGLAVKEVLPAFRQTNPVSVQNLRLPIDFDDYIKMFRMLLDIDARGMCAFFELGNSRPQMVRFLQDKLAAAEWDDELTSLVDALNEFQNGAEWLPTAASAAKAIGSVEMTVEMLESVACLVRFNGHVTKKGAATLAADLNTEVGLGHISDLLELNKIELAAIVALPILAGAADIEEVQPKQVVGQQYYYQPPRYEQLPSETITANNIRKRLAQMLAGDITEPFAESCVVSARKHMRAMVWREIVVEDPRREAFVRRVSEDAISSKKMDFFGVEETLGNIDFWRGLLDDTHLGQLFESLSEVGNIAEWLLSKPYDRVFDRLYLKIVSTDKNAPLSGKIAGALRQVDTPEWQKDLKNDQARIQLAAAIANANLPVLFGNAIFNLAEESIQGDRARPTVVNPEHLLPILADDARSLLLGRLVGMFGSGSGPFAKAIPTWGELLAQALIAEGPEKAQVRMVETVKRAGVSELKWLAELLNRWGTNSTKAPHLRKVLKNTTREALEAAPDVTRKAALHIFSTTMNWTF